MIGQTSGIEKEVNCTAPPAQFTIATPGADDNTFSTANGPAVPLVGVFQLATNAGQPQSRIMLSGISRVLISGAVTRGNFITSDANGNGVAAAPAAGANAYVIGIAMGSGVAGQIIPVLLAPGRIQG